MKVPESIRKTDKWSRREDVANVDRSQDEAGTSGPTPMTSWGEFQWMVVLAGMVGGFGVAILGSIKLALAKRLAIDERRVGGLVSLFGFIMGPAILAAGFATDAIDKRWVIAVGGGVMTGSMVVLAIARRYGQALLGVLLLSGGWSVLVNVT